MKRIPSRWKVVVLAACALLLVGPMMVQAEYGPPEGSSLDCSTGDPAGDINPAGTDLVGDLSGENGYWTAASWYDSDDAGYFYFAQRLNGDPDGPSGFVQFAWTALMQVPSSPSYDANQYQYAVVLDGISSGSGDDLVKLQENTAPEDLEWDPILNDPSETTLWSHDFASGGPGVEPLGDAMAAYEIADSSIGGNADYILYWAIPIQVLIDQGIIADHTELSDILLMMATSANANNYNKDIIDDCTFQSPTAIDLISISGESFVYPWISGSVLATTALLLIGTAVKLRYRITSRLDLHTRLKRNLVR